MAEGIMGEIKRHPYTSVSALGCLMLCAVVLPFMWNNKASAGDVHSLEDKIAAVENTVRRESAATELNNVRRELFDVDLRIRTLERENINVDVLLYKRRDDLQSSQRQLEAKLRDIERAR
jgi:hypothetical protein